MLKIEAQSTNASLRYRASPGEINSSLSPPQELHHNPLLFSSSSSSFSPHASDVMVTVTHSPLHVGSFFQAPAPSGGRRGRAERGSCHCSAFTLASPACARVFPLRRCDLVGGGGAGAGAALFSAAAAEASRGGLGGGGGVGGGGAGGLDGGLLLSAEDVPMDERRRYRYVQ